MSAPVTIGIDLAAQPQRTSACQVTWYPDHLDVEYLPERHDAALLGLLAGPAKVGLDCPLGWPSDFVATVSAHHRNEPLPERVIRGALDPLSYRLTDEVTWQAGKLPLSVSTNLLGVVALRAARLLDGLRRDGVAVDRSGMTGPVAETYPGAALRFWRLAGPASYRKAGAVDARTHIIDGLGAQLGFPVTDEVRARCQASHDDLDAFVCALIARAVDLGRTTPPLTSRERQLAVVEGWIHVPTCPPVDLLPSR